MSDNKNFTEYTDKELDDWFITHIKGWSGYNVVGPEKNFQAVIAEMQRRYIKAQKEGTIKNCKFNR